MNTITEQLRAFFGNPLARKLAPAALLAGASGLTLAALIASPAFAVTAGGVILGGINGMWSGWAGPGPKTIIPSKAGAKLSSRLVANQDPQTIFQKLKQYIEAITPDAVKLDIQLLTEGRPALIPFDIPEMQAAARAYKTGWGYEPVFTRGGGSIPVVADIGDMLKIPVVMMGYGLDSDGLHSPNESYSIEMFQRGIETAIVYLDELAQLPS